MHLIECHDPAEVIPPHDRSVRLVAAPHPFRTERVDVYVEAGLSIAEMLERAQADAALRRHAHVFIGEHYIPRENWTRVRPKPGAVVTARVVPTGGGGGKSPLRTILTLAVLAAGIAFAPALAGAIGITSAIGVSLVQVGIGVVGSLIVNALAPPPKQKLGGLSGDTRDSPTLFIGGARNQARPFGVVPRVLGKHRMYPPLGALSYTETRGDEQYLHMLVTWGYGPLDITDLKIGETPIAQFDGVTVQTRSGYADDDPIDLYPFDVLEEALSIELTKAGGWSTRTTQPGTDRISVDVTCPQGVVEFDDAGHKKTRTVTLEVAYRSVGSGGYTTAGSIVITEQRTNAVRRNLSWNVTRGQYDVRVRRTTADAVSTQIFDGSYWTALRSITREDPISFPHPTARTAVEIKATDQLTGTIDELNAVVTSVLPDWDAATETWVERATSRPASLYREVLQGTANARKLPDSRVDLDNLAYWHARNVALGQEFNMVIDYKTTVAELLHDIAACGRARPTRRDGKWGVVIDEPKTVPVQLLSERNSWGFRGRLVFPAAPHGWRIRFVNRNAGWRPDERIVYDDGYTAANATRFEAMELAAITDPAQVWRDGRFHVAQARLRPHLYELNADPEHLLAGRGDLVLVRHDMLLVGLAAGRIKSVTRDEHDDVTALTLDETVTMEAGTLYGLVIRTVSDVAVTGVVVTAPGESAALELETPILAAAVPAVDEETGDGLIGCLAAFGERGRETAPYLVKNIRRGHDLSALIELVDAAPAVHNADSGAIPAFTSGITLPAGLTKPAVGEIRSDESVLLRDVDGALSSRIVVQLLRTGAAPARVTGIEAAFRPADSQASWVYLPPAAADAAEISIPDVEDGAAYEIRLRYTTTGQPGPWTQTHLHTVIGKSTPPPDPYGLVVEGDWLRWLHDSPRDHRGFLVRHVPGTAAEWGRGIAAHSGVLPAPELSIANLPRGARVYMVKAVDVAGNESSGFASVTRDLGDTAVANVVLTRDLVDEDFPGAVEGGAVTSDVLEADDTTLYLPAAMAPYLPDGDASYLPSEFLPVSYETETIVPGGDEAPSRLLAQVTAAGLWSLEYVREPREFVARAVRFDGTNDYLTRGAALTGAADSRTGMCVFSIHLSGSSGGYVLGTSPVSAEISVDSDGALSVFLRGAFPTLSLWYKTAPDTVTPGSGWHTFLVSWDSEAAERQRVQIYDRHEDKLFLPAADAANVDIRFATSTDWIVGARLGVSNEWDGCLGELALWIGERLDLSVEANRLKLIDADGYPIDLGANGELPTGTAPILHLRRRPGDEPADFGTNHGTGGDLTVTGALGACDDGPTPQNDWRPWPDSVDVESGDELAFRWSAAGGATQGKLSAFALKFDVPDESESHAAMAIAATTGTRVSLAKSYRSITVVNATLHGGGTAVTVEIGDKDAELGPLLVARDASGDAVAATVDVHIQGVKA